MRNSLQFKVVSAVSMASFIGLATLTYYLNFVHEQTTAKQNQTALISVLDTSVLSINTLMNSGYADLGDVLRESLMSISDVMDIKVARIDGTEAFLDNKTVDEVNKRIGYEQFDTFRDSMTQRAIELPAAEIDKIIRNGDLYEKIDTLADGTRLQTLIYPIISDNSCVRCHGADDKYLGFIQLKTSLASVDQALLRSRWITYGIATITLLSIMLVINIYVRRVVLPPVAKLSTVIANITGQNLTETIELVSHVEFSRIANIFNLMVHRLSMSYAELTTERDKLSTLILDAREGIVVTDPYGKVVLTNSAASELLSKNQETISAGGMKALFDDAEVPIAHIIEGSPTNTPSTLVPYRNKTLSVQLAEVLTKNGTSVGTAAIFKDVTAEIKTQEDLKQLARTDNLTGLYNRRHFDETSKIELSRAVRYHHPISVLIIDIDHFKMVNDTHGHNVGDTVIKAISKLIKEAIREFDIACRYGGEEFVVLLPNAPVQDAYAFCERLRKMIEAWHLGDLSVTVSIGLAGAPPNPQTSIDDLVKAADLQLYQAKHAGRNQVMCQWHRDT